MRANSSLPLRKAVTIDLKAANFKEGSKNFERVLWSFTNQLQKRFNLLVVCKASGPLLFFPDSVLVADTLVFTRFLRGVRGAATPPGQPISGQKEGFSSEEDQPAPD